MNSIIEISDNSYNPYRFGFNGKEKNDYAGNSYDFGARMYDPRIGRWLSLDPLMNKYPSLSAYNFCADNPMIFIDPSGKIIVPAGKEERKLLKSMINNYFGSDAGFSSKRDKIHFNQKKFDKFMKTCTDPDMIENANRFKEIVTNEKYTTVVSKATSASVSNEITTLHNSSTLVNSTIGNISYPNGTTTIPYKTEANLSSNEPGKFFYNTDKGNLLPNSGVLINPTQGIELDAKTPDFDIRSGQSFNLNNLYKVFSTPGGTAFHELIGHTYDAYKGLFQKPAGNESDSGVKQENDFNKKAGIPLRSGSDH